jgi:hypothetical protein
VSSSSSGFLVPSFKNVGEEGRKVEGKCCKLSDGFFFYNWLKRKLDRRDVSADGECGCRS